VANSSCVLYVVTGIHSAVQTECPCTNICYLRWKGMRNLVTDQPYLISTYNRFLWQDTLIWTPIKRNFVKKNHDSYKFSHPQEIFLHIILSYNIYYDNKYVHADFSDPVHIFNFTTSSWPEKPRIFTFQPVSKKSADAGRRGPCSSYLVTRDYSYDVTVDDSTYVDVTV